MCGEEGDLHVLLLLHLEGPRQKFKFFREEVSVNPG